MSKHDNTTKITVYNLLVEFSNGCTDSEVHNDLKIINDYLMDYYEEYDNIKNYSYADASTILEWEDDWQELGSSDVWFKIAAVDLEINTFNQPKTTK